MEDPKEHVGEGFYADVFPLEVYSIFYQREATVIFKIIRTNVCRDDCFQPSAKLKAIQCTKSDSHLCPLLQHIVKRKGQRMKSKMAELEKGWNLGLI